MGQAHAVCYDKVFTSFSLHTIGYTEPILQEKLLKITVFTYHDFHKCLSLQSYGLSNHLFSALAQRATELILLVV